MSGIPQAIALVVTAISDGLPPHLAKDWPIRVESAIPEGADLSMVQWQFLHWILTDPAVNPGIVDPGVRGAVNDCATLIRLIVEGEVHISSAESLAEAAARAAESSAWSVVRSVWSVSSAAEASARAAESSGMSARSASESVIWSARSASVVWSAWSSKSVRTSTSARYAEYVAWAAESLAEAAARAAESFAWATLRTVRSAMSDEDVDTTARAAESFAWAAMADKLLKLLEDA